MEVPQWEESVTIQRVEEVIFTLKDLMFLVGGKVREIKKKLPSFLCCVSTWQWGFEIAV